MTRTQWSRAITLSGAVLVAISLVLGLTPSPAGSATVQEFTAVASGEAIELDLLGFGLVDPGPRTADSTRTPVESGPTTGDLIDLPLLADLVAAGVLAQEVAVDDQGNSAACAGLLAPGGQLNISGVTPPDCTVDIGTPGVGTGGVIVNLGGLGLFRLRIGAVVAECQAGPFGAQAPEVTILGLGLDAGISVLGIFIPVGNPIFEGDILAPSPDQDVLPDLLNGILDLYVNDQPDVPQPGVSETIALHLLGLNGTLAELKIGEVRCGANSVQTGSADFDTSGSFDGTVQPNTQNAVLLGFTPDEDELAVTFHATLGDGTRVDDGRALPAGCSVAPNQRDITCLVGAVDSGQRVTRTIPVVLEPGLAGPATASLVIEDENGSLFSSPIQESVGTGVTSTAVSGDAGGLAVPDPNRTGLPTDIDGTLYLDVPSYVEEAAYGGTACTPAPFDPGPTVYPAIPGNTTFNCGSAIAQSPSSEPALAFTYADSAPPTGGTPDPGRVVIVRGPSQPGTPLLAANSYYADLSFAVDDGPPPAAPGVGAQLDTSGSLVAGTVQPNTENAVQLTYQAPQARSSVFLTALLGDGLDADEARGLPAGCTSAAEGSGERVTCSLGDVPADTLVQRVIPVEIEPGAGPTVQVTTQAASPTAGDLVGTPAVVTAETRVESTNVAGDAGDDVVVADPDRTGLPGDIDGLLYVSAPSYVESVTHRGTACTAAVFDPDPSVYPAVPGNTTFACGDASPGGTAPALAFSYADSAPPTEGTPDPGRVVILRNGQGPTAAAIPGNSYVANLAFFVDEAAPPPTLPPPTQPTLPPTLPPTQPTTPPTVPTTDSTVAPTVAPSSSLVTSTTARPLARTGSDTRTTLSLALGLLGAGMVVTGRGMTAEVHVLGRRRRP